MFAEVHELKKRFAEEMKIFHIPFQENNGPSLQKTIYAIARVRDKNYSFGVVCFLIAD